MGWKAASEHPARIVLFIMSLVSLADLQPPGAPPGLIGQTSTPLGDIIAVGNEGGPRALPDCSVPPLSHNAVCNISLCTFEAGTRVHYFIC